MNTALAIGRYDFQQLRERLGVQGRPMPERTARRVAKKIDHIAIGRRMVWTEQAVQRFEARRAINAI